MPGNFLITDKRWSGSLTLRIAVSSGYRRLVTVEITIRPATHQSFPSSHTYMTKAAMSDLHIRPSRVKYQELYCSGLHKRPIQAIALSEDGEFLASGGQSFRFRIIRLTGRYLGDDRVIYVTKIASTQDPIASFKSIIDGPVVAIAWLEQLSKDDERMVLVGYLTGKFRLLRISTVPPYKVSFVASSVKGLIIKLGV
jgi:hypothetical protein